MHQPIKAVLFDLDDTLWPIMPVIQRAEAVLYDWLAGHAPAVAAFYTIAELRQQRLALMATHPRFQFDLVALRRTALIQAFERVGADTAVVDDAMTLFNAERNKVEFFDDVLPALDRLGQQYILGAVTNGASDLDAIGIAHHFDAAVSAHAFGTAKPDRAIFLAGCNALGVSPDEAIYVGDDPALDIDGAQQAGLRAAWVNRFERPLPGHIAPDVVCATLADLEQWLAMQPALARLNRAS